MQMGIKSDQIWVIASHRKYTSVCLCTLSTKEVTSDWTCSNPVINLSTKNETTKTALGSEV